MAPGCQRDKPAPEVTTAPNAGESEPETAQDDPVPATPPTEEIPVFTFECHSCDEVHEGIPDFGYDYPDYYFEIPEDEREKRIEMTTETCVVDNEHFFIRGVIEIPVVGSEEVLGLGVWQTLSDVNFKRYSEFRANETNPAEDEKQLVGWISNTIPGYPTLLRHLGMLHVRGDGLRPAIKLQPTDHPLSQEQQHGISRERLTEIVTSLLHPPQDTPDDADAPWPFADSPDVATITTRAIVAGDDWIAYVSHDAEDEGWQFLGPNGAPEPDAASVVGLKTIVRLDPSVTELHDLPLGWHASRSSRDAPGNDRSRSKWRRWIGFLSIVALSGLITLALRMRERRSRAALESPAE